MRTILLIGVAVAGMAQTQLRPAGEGINFYSKDQEVALGQMQAKSVRANSTPVGIDAVSEYVRGLGARLAVQMPGWDYQFEVIRGNAEGPAHEPRALPGGPIFVSADLILAARTEAEFAGMLAHAMAHVESRHGTRLATKGALLQIGNLGAQMPQIQDASTRSTAVSFLAFQRSFEKEADYRGVIAMAAAGFDPEGLASYIERAQPATENVMWDRWPKREDRVKLMREYITRMPAQSYQSSDVFSRIQALVK